MHVFFLCVAFTFWGAVFCFVFMYVCMLNSIRFRPGSVCTVDNQFDTADLFVCFTCLSLEEVLLGKRTNGQERTGQSRTG